MPRWFCSPRPSELISRETALCMFLALLGVSVVLAVSTANSVQSGAHDAWKILVLLPAFAVIAVAVPGCIFFLTRDVYRYCHEVSETDDVRSDRLLLEMRDPT
eukprot:TRINITY_DN49451_c0_g1_i1.p2 TRINITY_DN49451_c0_g1~~TRINITY_DN49451_c0_g1_i1.p2  ORF type:complete len:103 (-),score=4.21 TRINITY_DN49451_c0_g1_i1:488-796(-)